MHADHLPTPSTKRLAVLLMSLLMLSACGFHLRGSYDMPASLSAITLTAPASSAALKQELALTLARSKVGTDGGDVELEVTREVLTKQTTTVDSRAKAAEYTLVYAVDYRLNHLAADTRGPIQSLILRRGYQYDSTSIVGKNTEEETLVVELRRDAAQQIVRQLRAYTPPATPVEPEPAAPAAATAPATQPTKTPAP